MRFTPFINYYDTLEWILFVHMNSIVWNSSIQYFSSGHYFLDIQYIELWETDGQRLLQATEPYKKKIKCMLLKNCSLFALNGHIHCVRMKTLKQPWCLYKMAAQNTFQKVVSEKKILIDDSFDVTKCLRQIKISDLLYMCKPCSELPCKQPKSSKLVFFSCFKARARNYGTYCTWQRGRKKV